MKNRLLMGHVMAFIVSIIWGSTFIASKLLLNGGCHPVELIIYRFTLAWCFLFLFSPKPMIPKSFREEWPFMVAGLTGLTLYFFFENTALTFTLASNCGIILSTAPMFTAMCLWLSRRTPRPRASFFLGFAVAMTGIIIISLGGASLQLNPVGDLLCLASALCWGLYGIFLEISNTRGLTILQCTRKVFFWGLVFTLLCSLFYRGQLDLLDLSRFAQPELLFCILYLSFGASATCFILWNSAINIIGTVATSLYIYLTPIITLVASYLVLDEPITPTAIGATGLIIAGLWLSQKKPVAPATPEA